MPERDNGRVHRRRFLETTGGIAAGAAIAGCTGNNETETADPGGEDTDSPTETTGSDDPSSEDDTDTATPAPGGTLDLVEAFPEDNYDPIDVGDPWLHDTLFVLDEAEVVPQLATDWEVSDDGTVYTFSIKEGVQYHGDWGEVTAQDFVYAWERVAAAPESTDPGAILEGLGVEHETTTDDEGNEVYEPGSMAVEAVDDFTLEVTLAEPNFLALGELTFGNFPPIPEGIVGDIEGYEGEMDQSTYATETPIGCGPFVLEELNEGESRIYSAHEDYHGEGPFVDGINMKVIQDPSTRYNWAMNKNADQFAIPNAQFDREKVDIQEEHELGRRTGRYGPLRNDDTVDYTIYSLSAVDAIQFNCSRVIKPVRVATAKVLDRLSIVNDLDKGLSAPAYHVTPITAFPGGAEGYDEHAQDYPHGFEETQISEARALMEDAGYTDDDPYEFTYATLSGFQIEQQIARVIRDRLAAANIRMNIESGSYGSIFQQFFNGQLDSFRIGWGTELPTPNAIVRDRLIAATDEGNAASWNDSGDGIEARSQALDAWETVQNNRRNTESAAQARAEAYKAIERANWEDVVMLPFGHQRIQWYTYDWAEVSRKPFTTQGFANARVDTGAKPDN